LDIAHPVFPLRHDFIDKLSTMTCQMLTMEGIFYSICFIQYAYEKRENIPNLEAVIFEKFSYFLLAKKY
tara:strand:- start:1941 stop:2147 length:207 start_codon:yes stop_codon:yes gene_type:complete